MARELVFLPDGTLREPPDGYLYRGTDGGNEYLPELSGHYWTNGYAIWRPPVGSHVKRTRNPGHAFLERGTR